MSKTNYFRIAVPLLAIIASLLVSEFIFRALLFSNLPFMKNFRNPNLYASYSSDDEYWLLQNQFNGKYRPPKEAHPMLGWIGAFDRNRLIHNDAPQLRGRRPVLLYGDSFAECTESPCFQDVLNGDPTFSKKCFLLNYGVTGYGLDQIYMLMHRSVPTYKEPVVIFSLLTEDIDRSILSVRTGQKPRFRLVDGQLRLTGVSIDSDPTRFFSRTRPRIPSYLFRLALYRSVFPDQLVRTFTGEEEKRNEKIALTRAILKEAISDLRGRGLEFVFLIFVADWPGESSVMEENDWRLDTIVGVLDEENISYLSTKNILRENMARTGQTVRDYFIPGDGHYNGHTNTLIAERLKIALTMCGG